MVDVFTVSPYKFERDMFRNPEARVVMFVHGGAFIIGDKSDHRAFADTVLRILVEDSRQDMRNVCVAIPNYTLSSVNYRSAIYENMSLLVLCFAPLLCLGSRTAFVLICVILFAVVVLASSSGVFEEIQGKRRSTLHPVHTKDVAGCIAMLQHHTQSQRRIFLVGHSAGGFITSNLALDPCHLRQHGFEWPRDALQTVVCISGPYNVKRLKETRVGDIVRDSAFGLRAGHATLFKQIHALHAAHGHRSEWPGSIFPHLYLVNATYDFTLTRHAYDLSFLLNETGIPFQRFSVKRSNHFSVKYLRDDENDTINLVRSLLVNIYK